MRKPNLELNRIKLAQKELQLAQIENQLAELKSKIDSVTERLTMKHDEVNAIRELLSQTGTVTPTVSE